MSVSGELLCSFELLKPLDSSALKSHIKKGRNKRNSILNSPVSHSPSISVINLLNRNYFLTKTPLIACYCLRAKLLDEWEKSIWGAFGF